LDLESVVDTGVVAAVLDTSWVAEVDGELAYALLSPILLLQSLGEELELGALLALFFFRHTSRDLVDLRRRNSRRTSLGGDGEWIDVASAVRMVAMARLVQSVEVAAQIVDTTVGGDGALVWGAESVAAGIEGDGLRE
jgi:hypothetical protein